MASPHKVYVFHRSYFCGKLLAYLRYKEIAHEPVYDSLAKVGATLMAKTGLRQMPVVETPAGEWLQDTTPILDWFEERYSQGGILPQNTQNAFIARLIEDYADEWLWRPAIYYRWMHQADRALYKDMFVEEFIGGFWASNTPLKWIAGKLVHKHQLDKFLYGDGMTEGNRKHVESIYVNTLDRLETIFQQRPYVLGDRPSLADFGFFGSMFWHFSNDPTSNRIMQERAPGVNEWVARMWNARHSRFKEAKLIEDTDQLLDSLGPILEDICRNYLPYLEQNALEFRQNNKRFGLNIEGYYYPDLHVSPYRVWCRERLRHHFLSLAPDDQTQLRQKLSGLGGLDSLFSHPEILSDWDPCGLAPLCEPGKVPLTDKLLARFTGSNHIRSRRAWVKA